MMCKKRAVFLLCMSIVCCLFAGCGIKKVNSQSENPFSLTQEEKKLLSELQDYMKPYVCWEMGTPFPETENFFDVEKAKTQGKEYEVFFQNSGYLESYSFRRAGDYEVKFQVSGKGFEGLIRVTDSEAPVIVLPQEETEYELGSSILYRKGVTVSDNSGDAKLVIYTDDVNVNVAGSYEVRYVAVDESGNRTEVVRQIKIGQTKRATEEETHALAEQLLREITTEEMSLYEKAEAIFNWCYNNIRFVADADKSGVVQGAYDGMHYRTGDCYTFYATAEYLMDLCGIENRAVSRTGITVTHYWSLVNVGDGWYHFDCSPHKKGYKCFMQTDEQVKEYAQKNEKNPDYFDYQEVFEDLDIK